MAGMDLQVGQPLGLGAEAAMLRTRFEALALHRRAGLVALSAPRGRGKSALWQAVYRECEGEMVLPDPIVVDADQPAHRIADLFQMVHTTQRLSSDERQVLLTHLKTLLQDDVLLPHIWRIVIQSALAEPRVLAIVQARASQPELLDMAGLLDLLLDCFAQLCMTSAILVLENLERIGRGELLYLLAALEGLASQSPPPPLLILLTVAGLDSLTPETRLVWEQMSEPQALTCYHLPPFSRADIENHVGPMSPELLDEVWRFCDGKAGHFLRLWREVPDSGLVARPGGTWDYAERSADGRHATLAGQLDRAFHAILESPEVPAVAQQALQFAAIQGGDFLSDVVSEGLWHLEQRTDRLRRDERQVTDRLFAEKLSELVDVIPLHDAAAGMGGYRFHSPMFQQFIATGLDHATRQRYALATAQGIEHLQALYTGPANWLALDLLVAHDLGTSAGAISLRQRCLTLPTPGGREWDLRTVAAGMRDLFSATEWCIWAIDFATQHRVLYPAPVLLALLTEADAAAQQVGRDDLRLDCVCARLAIRDVWCEVDGLAAERDLLVELAARFAGQPAPTARATLWLARSADDDGRRSGDIDARLAVAVDALAAIACGGQVNESLAHLLIELRLEQGHRALAGNRFTEAAASFSAAILDCLMPVNMDPHAETGGASGATVLVDADVTQPGNTAVRTLLATAYNGKALTAHLQGDVGDALTPYRQALVLRALDFGDRPAFAQSLANLGALCHDRNERELAEEFLRQSLAIRVGMLGDHPDSALTLNLLAMLYVDLLQHDMARECTTRAMSIQMKRLGEHPATARSFYQLGSIFCAQADAKRALAMAWQALRMLQKADPDSPDLPLFLRSYAYLLRRSGRIAEARDWENLAEDREHGVARQPGTAADPAESASPAPTASGRLSESASLPAAPTS